MLMAASMSQTMATAPRMIRTVSMLAHKPEIPPPPIDVHWFYLVIVLLIVALVAVAILAADLLN